MDLLFGNAKPVGKIYLVVYAVVMTSWVCVSTVSEYSLGNVNGVYGTLRHILDEGSDKLGFIWSIALVVVEGGLTTMVMGAYEKHIAGPRREAMKRAEQAEKELAEWNSWNERRLRAEACGQRFDEPAPGSKKTTGTQ